MGTVIVRRYRLFLSLILLVAIAPVVRADDLPDATVRRLEALVKAHMAREEIPGLSIALVTDSRLRWTGGFGLADVENAVPATARTVYRLASLSKPITAVAVMQLAERGNLDLDAPIRRFVPEFPEKRWPITVRQLLGHLGGVRHVQGREWRITRHYSSLLEGLTLFKEEPLIHEPGTEYRYTTHGYTLLGCAIEAVSGERYIDYVLRRIARPAGMTNLREDSVSAIIPRRAQGYRKSSDGELRNSVLADTSYKIPGGGLCATAEDVARFGLAAQSGALVEPSTLAAMWTPQRTRAGKETAYGLGWSLSEWRGRKQIGHGGGQPRVSTLLTMVPREGFTLALMANLEQANLRSLARGMMELVMESAQPQSSQRAQSQDGR